MSGAAEDCTPALEGTVVIDLSTVGPASRATRLLADFGARVVKVGAVPRAGAVQIVPPPHAYGGHRGMQRVLLDLKHDEGREAFLRLAEVADVVVESFRPGVADRLGVGYCDVRRVRPDVVYCSTSGYGQTGPYASWAGHDLDYLALGGFLDCGGRGPDGRPPLPGATVADAAAGGMQAVIAVLAALVRRSRTGEGAHLDVSIVDGVLALMALHVDEYLATGEVPGPGHSMLTGRYACYDTYACSDGRWLAVAAIEPAFYRNLCRLLDLDHWADHQLDDDAQDAIRAEFASVFATRTRDAWVSVLAAADTCVAPVLSVPEVVEDPHVQARGLVAEAVPVDGGAPFRQLGTLLAGTDTSRRSFEVRDPRATDTTTLMAELGYTPEEIARLSDKGVVA